MLNTVKMIKFVKITTFFFISIFYILLTKEIQKNDLYKGPLDIKPITEHRHGIITGNSVSNENNEQGNVENIRNIRNIRGIRNEETNAENKIGMDFVEQTNTQVEKQSLKKNTNEKDVSIYKNKESVNNLSALNISTKLKDKHVSENKNEEEPETLTTGKQNEEPQNKNMFKNIQNYFYSFNDSNKREYYHIKLQEKNFRWSLPVLLGSHKASQLLHIVTSTPFTALYCSINVKDDKSDPKIKYELTNSEDINLIECTNLHCESLKVKKVCLPLHSFSPFINQFVIKKKNCQERFCDYVHSINFLNLQKNFDIKNLSLCTFHYNVGYDSLKGFFFSDSFYIKKKVKETYSYWGCINENDSLKLNDVNSGFLGLATYDVNQKQSFPSILNNFIERSTGKKNIFALCLVEKGGFITFGGYDNSLFKSKADAKPNSNVAAQAAPEENASDQKLNLVWLNYSDTKLSVYNLLLKEIACTEKEKVVNFNINEEVLADTYNFYLHLPETFITKINSLITEKCKTQVENVCTEIHNKGLVTIAKGSVNDYPKIELKFDKESVFIEPNDYIIQMSGNKYKILLKTSNVTKLGIPFFLNKYVVFDNTSNKMGIGRSECKLNIDENDLTGMNISEETPTAPNIEKEIDEEAAFFVKHQLTLQIISGLCFLCALGVIIYLCYS